jgi:CheY-like chemotaxis protein
MKEKTIDYIPIIVLSAYDEMEKCEELGVDGFVSKPIDVENL